LHDDRNLGALPFKLGRSGQANDEFWFPAPNGGREFEAVPGSQLVPETAAIFQPIFKFLGFKITGGVIVNRLAATAVEGFLQIVYHLERPRVLTIIHFHVIEEIGRRRAMARAQEQAAENNRAEVSPHPDKIVLRWNIIY
jgi:hypothetical protein